MFLNLQSKVDTHTPPRFGRGAVSKEELGFEAAEVMASAFPFKTLT